MLDAVWLQLLILYTGLMTTRSLQQITLGSQTQRGRKRATLTVNFLKKYIHYAKHRTQPELTDEASDPITTIYAELKNASTTATSGGGILRITTRTLKTIIRLICSC